MIQRKCPKCKSGIMSIAHTFRGWGNENLYICDKCGHYKNIYENRTITPFLFFIFIELLFFISSDNVSSMGYLIYLTILLLLIYSIYKTKIINKRIKNLYPIINNHKEKIVFNDLQKSIYEKIKKEKIATGKKVKIIIALFIMVSYTLMFFYSKNDPDLLDYIGYFFIALLLPIWLVFTKFNEEK